MNDEIIITLPKLHPAQRQLAANHARFRTICAGRRFGKDIYMERDIIKTAIKYKGFYGWFAPEYRMMADNYRDIVNLSVPIIKSANKAEHNIQLINGSIIDFWSLDNYNAARGHKYHKVKINEAATSSNLMDAWDYVIRQTLADYRGSADFASTPKGLNGFYKLYQAHKEDPDWAHFHFTTYDNPYIPLDEIQAMKDSLPERVYLQEIMAQFVEDGSYFQNIDKCAVLEECDKPEDHKDHQLYGGLDWAMSDDYTVLTIACQNCKRVVFWDRFNQIDYTYQRERIKETCNRWKLAGLLPERNSIGEPNIEILQAAGLQILNGIDSKPGFYTGATTKPVLIQKLAAALEHDNFKVPKEYADELRSYEVETMSSGHTKFSAPSGYHDDCVISLALCWFAMSTPVQIFI